MYHFIHVVGPNGSIQTQLKLPSCGKRFGIFAIRQRESIDGAATIFHNHSLLWGPDGDFEKKFLLEPCTMLSGIGLSPIVADRKASFCP